LSAQCFAEGGDTAATLRVRGEATASAPPDQVEIDFSVLNEAREADAAARSNAKTQAEVVRALQAVLGGRGKVATQGYALRPRFHYPKDAGQRIVGYTASNTVRVVSDDLDSTGALIDAGIAAGANQVQRLHFGLKDPAALRSQALAQAAREARVKAQAMADALQLKILRIVHVEEEGLAGVSPRRPEMMMARAEAATGATTPVEAADVELRAAAILTAEVSEVRKP